MLGQHSTCKVSIIICTCNRVEPLQKTLFALARVCVPETMPTELIVVDNASTDATAEVVQQCRMPNMPVRYIHESKPGQCHARNTGLVAAQGDIILFTDDDVRPPFNWIEGMCRSILFGEADAVAGGVRFAPHLQRDWMQPRHRALLASTERIDPLCPQDMVGANMAFSKHVLEKVPQFDTALGPGALGFVDDSLFSMQLKEGGYWIGSALDIEVEHHFQESRLLRASFIQTAKKFGQSAAYTSYHWHHDDPNCLHFGLLKKWFQLRYWRATHHLEAQASEGISVHELNLVSSIYFYRHLIHMQHTLRLYQKRGLIKMSTFSI